MKNRQRIIWSCILFGLFPLWCTAQLKPDFFPEDIDAWDEQGRCIFCKPGVRNKSRSRGIALVYGGQGKTQFPIEGSDPSVPANTLEQLRLFMFDLKVPLVNKEKFKLLLSYKFLRESYAFSPGNGKHQQTLALLDQQALKSNSIGLIVSKPLDETTYLAFQAKYTANGNYPTWMSFKKAASIYKLRAVLGIKPSEDFEWGLGLNFSKSFRRLTLIPFLIFNRNFNQNWGIESVIPAYVFLRYNLNKRNILLLGPQYVSRSYRLQSLDDQMELFDYAFNHSEILSTLRWQHQWIPWVWSSLRVGYQINFSTDFESQNDLFPSLQADLGHVPHFQVSVFLSPPR